MKSQSNLSTANANTDNPLGIAPTGRLLAKFAIPAIISNMKVNIGLCLVGVIIGEFLAARSGLGYLIIYSSQVFKLDWLLMSICILCIIAVLLYAIIGLIEKWYLKKTG